MCLLALILLAGCALVPTRDGAPTEDTAGVLVPNPTATAPSDGGPVVGGSRTLVPTPAPLPDAEPAEPTAMFTGTISEITPELAERMTTTWRPECPVPLEDLRYLTLSHVDFDGQARLGEMVVHADAAEDVVTVFRTLFADRYPIRQMRLMDDFGGDVNAGLEADNTSAFNCRTILRGTGWSEHAYGRAIDVNPLENPYWHPESDFLAPAESRRFVDRPEDEPAVIQDGDGVVRAFAEVGWKWGGHWPKLLDWMHFSPSGR